MPIKRRSAKRRVDAERLFEIWAGCLESGFDYFDDLPGAGIATDALGRPPRAEAREAWATYGQRIMAERAPGDREPWAALEFGQP